MPLRKIWILLFSLQLLGQTGMFTLGKTTHLGERNSEFKVKCLVPLTSTHKKPICYWSITASKMWCGFSPLLVKESVVQYATRSLKPYTPQGICILLIFKEFAALYFPRCQWLYTPQGFCGPILLKESVTQYFSWNLQPCTPQGICSLPIYKYAFLYSMSQYTWDPCDC